MQRRQVARKLALICEVVVIHAAVSLGLLLLHRRLRVVVLLIPQLDGTHKRPESGTPDRSDVRCRELGRRATPKVDVEHEREIQIVSSGEGEVLGQMRLGDAVAAAGRHLCVAVHKAARIGRIAARSEHGARLWAGREGAQRAKEVRRGGPDLD